jgi:dimeric dUTPase (all-alpha-NTP-PPase superfamily)
MQFELNDQTIDGWYKKSLPWHTAIMVEVAEGIESTSWKWWKSSEADLENLKVELIDILHFSISALASDAVTPSYEDEKHEIAEKLAGEMDSIYQYATDAAIDDSEKFLIATLESIASAALSKEYKIALFHLWMAIGALDMSLDEVYHRYLTKNLLNSGIQNMVLIRENSNLVITG